MTEIIIDGFATDKPTGDLRDVFGDPFKDFRETQEAKKQKQWQEIEIDLNPEVNPLSPEGFDQTFQQVAQATKPRVKGIGEDWFRNLLRQGLRNAECNKKQRELSPEEFTKWLDSNYRDGSVGDDPKFTKHNMEVAYNAGMQAIASDPTSKQQHGDHKADGKIAKAAKIAQDHKMKKQQALRELQKRLAFVNSKRPKDPTKVKAWSDRRQALVKKIQEKRESMRFSDKRVANLREERRGN
jgi:hypothetical protein